MVGRGVSPTGTKTNLSSVFHPQSDGQTERTNQTIEHFMRCFCDYQQDNWSQILAHAEFAYNNSFHSSIGMSPFLATYGFHPTATLSTPLASSPTSSSVPDTAKHVSHLRQLHLHAQQLMTISANRHAYYYNNHHPPHNPDLFKPGMLVMLVRRNIKSSRPIPKFEDRLICPFPIVSAVGSHAYRLRLGPLQDRLHPVFHVDLLRPYKDPLIIPSRPRPARPVPSIPTAIPHVVDRILDSRSFRGRLQYLVRWQDYAPENDQWIPHQRLAAYPTLTKDFHSTYPQKPNHPKQRSLRLTVRGQGLCHPTPTQPTQPQPEIPKTPIIDPSTLLPV